MIDSTTPYTVKHPKYITGGNMSKVYTATEAAKVLDVTTQCVSNLIKRNRLQAGRDGKQWKIPPESIIAYANLRLAELDEESKELKKVLKFLQ